MIALTEAQAKISSGYIRCTKILIEMYLLSNTLMLHVLMWFLFLFCRFVLKTDGSVYCICGVLHVNSKLLKQTSKTSKPVNY